MNIHRSQKFAELAPLTQSFAVHLATYLLRTLPRQTGRPRKTEMDISEQTEMRLLEAMDYLISLVKEKRQLVYDLVNPAVLSGKLTPKWFMQTLEEYMPDDTIVYPQRVREWRQSHLLYLTAEDRLDPQSISRFLFARMIDSRRSGWLPRPAAIESYWTWRLDAPNLPPFPYEAPLVLLDDIPEVPIYKSRPEPGVRPYVLTSPWKGAAWDDPAWVVFDTGAARWVGDPTNEQLDQWTSPEERAALPSAGAGGQAEALATQVLRLIVATRIPHQSTSS